MVFENVQFNVRVDKVDNRFNVTVTDVSTNPPTTVNTSVRTYGNRIKPLVRAFEIALQELEVKTIANEVTTQA